MKNYAARFRASLVFAFVLIGSVPGSTQALSLYDDFSSSAIDPAKWQNLEIVREIRDGKLVSVLRASGPPGPKTNNLEFGNPSTILSFQADARLNSFTPPEGGSVLLRLRASLYNDGSNDGGDESGAMGDVHAVLFIRGTSDGTDIRYQVYRCDNPDCSTTSDVVPSTLVKTVNLGETHTLAMEWGNLLLTFSVDGEATTLDFGPVPPATKFGPNVPEKALGTQVITAGAGGIGSVAGDFDNVMVNDLIYDDFGGSRLDPVKWATLDFVQEVVDGRLVSKVAVAGSAGIRVRNVQEFANQNAVTGVSADVTVTEFQSSNSFVQVRALAGSFYNDGASTGGDDHTGDIQAILRIYSLKGGSLFVEFVAVRCKDAQCSEITQLVSSPFAVVNVGETHNLSLVWNGSVFAYGIDSAVRNFDPKPLARVVKPPTGHYKDLRTDTDAQADGGLGYISATFDNIFVNDAAVALPRLVAFIQEAVTGDVTSAGVGLRGTGTGVILLEGIPPGASVQRVLLYWATLGIAGTFTSPTLNGAPVAGTLIGQSDDPFWGAFQSFAYRADVTSLVSANGAYTVAGLPKDGPTVNDSQGASLVVIYDLPGAPSRVITINDGAVTLSPTTVSFYSTTLAGFAAADPPVGAKLTFIVGDGETRGPDYAAANAEVLATNQFNGGEGGFWDTRTFDVSAAVTAGATSANAIVSTADDELVWVAAILSVPGIWTGPTVALSVNQLSFQPGEELTLSATVTPGPLPMNADVYVAVGLPGGSLLFLQGDGNLVTAMQPLVGNWPIESFTGQIFTRTFDGGEPIGDYAWLAAFTQPGTLNLIGSIVSAPFSFGP